MNKRRRAKKKNPDSGVPQAVALGVVGLGAVWLGREYLKSKQPAEPAEPQQAVSAAAQQGAAGNLVGGVGSVVSSILGSLVGGGVMAYQTYADDQAQKRDLKARRAEVALAAEARAREAELQAMIAQQKQANNSSTIKYVAGGAAVLGSLALTGYLLTRGSK